MKPLVSICIPAYNGAQFIAEAMNSAIVQTYTNLEIIVSDDASKDNTLSIIESYKNKTNIPIHIYKHEPNGIGANWNHCVTQAKGEYIKFLFQDDILLPNCIENMMTMMLSHSNVGIVYCKRTFLTEGPAKKFNDFIDYYGLLHTYWKNIEVTQGVLPGKKYLKDPNFLKSPGNKIGEPTAVLLKKECFSKVGYFSLNLKQALDCHYWYLVMRKYHIGFVDDTLVKFRLHDKQATAVNKRHKVNEIPLLFREYYKHLFFCLNFESQLKLLKLYNPFVKLLVTLKQKLNA